MAESFVENDALPEEPRPLCVENEPQTVVQPTHTKESEALEQAIQQDFQAPTGPTWEFNRMLLKLSEELTDDNLEKLKFRFSGGEDGLGKGVQEKIKKPIELFRILEERHWLTRDNLLKLQAALRDIGRKDLVRVTAEYAQKIDNVLYFYQPSESVNGYRRVKLHLCNCNYKNTERNHIQMIRLRFSELVGCAQEDIVIVGLEPATSLILTFHVPESFMVTFKELLKMSTCKARLKDIGIDMMEIEREDELFHCSDEDVNTKPTTAEQKKLYNVYQLLENKTKLLDSAEVKLLELNERIDILENEKLQFETLMKSTKPEFVKSGGNMSSIKDGLLKTFHALLQRPELETCDKSLILSLLDTNSKMISTVVAESYESLIQQMRSEIQKMKLEKQQMELNEQRMELEIENMELKLRKEEELYQFELRTYRTSTDYDELYKHIFASSVLLDPERIAKRTDLPEAKEMYEYDAVPQVAYIMRHQESDIDISEESDSEEAKRTYLLKAKGMFQHLGSETKTKIKKEATPLFTTIWQRDQVMSNVLRKRTQESGVEENSFSPTASGSEEAKRTDLPEVKEMYQHLGSEPKRIADKTESESKREHTVSNIGKEDADSQVTKSMSQIQEIDEETSQYSLEKRRESGYIGDSSSLTQSDFDEDADSEEESPRRKDNQ